MEYTCPGTRALPCARRAVAPVAGAARLCPAAGLSLPALLAGREALISEQGPPSHEMPFTEKVFSTTGTHHQIVLLGHRGLVPKGSPDVIGHEKRTALTGRPCRIRWRAEPYRLAATLRSRRASWLVKPDSLSYQMMSLAMVPSRTWVDRASTTPPWVLPLKSMETRGSSQ